MAELRASAAYRIAFLYAAAFVLAGLLLGVAVYFAADAAFRRQMDQSIREEARDLLRDYAEEGPADLAEALATRSRGAGRQGFLYALVEPDGHVRPGRLRVAALAPGWHDIRFADPVEGADPARALVTRLADGRRLVVALDKEQLERIDRIVLVLFGCAFILFLLIGATGALLLGGYLRRRLGRIGATAQAIAGGDLSRRVPVSIRGDEFDELSLALNAMLERIAQLLDNLRQVSGDVAHDLRTPLARLRGGLEAALAQSGDAAAQRDALTQALHQSDRLLALFAAILRISEVEGGAIGASFARVELSELMGDLCDSYAPAVEDGGRLLSCRIEPGLAVWGERELIAQAIVNLLDNAQRHTPAGTAIALTAEPEGRQAAVTVADNGPGVPDGECERITRRFVRLDTSRATAGHGLGLNLVSAVAAVHRGRLLIEGNAPGLRATLLLPRVPS